MFVDTAKIRVTAGHGGRGCQSFLRIDPRKKKPTGGDGGKGGDVLFQVNPAVDTLLDFYYLRHFRAEAGSPGGSNNKQGKQAKDLILKVPAGTIVIDAETGLKLRDLRDPDESVIVVKGGAGGKGNAGGKVATKGEPGEEREVILELRLIADCGIVGLPNVGKSTLLSKLTSAHPKIADYPFTTKNPQLGVMADKKRDWNLVIADIPGLIEGAHSGRGLGDRFLRHIERTSFLVHLVDMSARKPVEDYEILKQELSCYGQGLSKKPEILVGNKMDLPGTEEKLTLFQKSVRKRVIPISARSGMGLDLLADAIFRMYGEEKRVRQN